MISDALSFLRIFDIWNWLSSDTIPIVGNPKQHLSQLETPNEPMHKSEALITSPKKFRL